MTEYRAYSIAGQEVLLGGVPLAGIVKAEVRVEGTEYPVVGHGDCSASEVLIFDKEYSITLEREISAGDGFDIYNADGLKLKLGGCTYGDCRVVSVSEQRKSDGSLCQSVKLRALSRTEAGE